MPSIPDYAGLIKMLLGEAAKYFALLFFSVLAIRLWRRLAKIHGEDRWKNSAVACLSSLLACVIGYFSICHSLSLLYFHYGTKAFDAGNLSSASSLFQTSSAYWKSADAAGKSGICLLLSDEPDQGMRLLDEARDLRKGRNSSFELFHEGLYYFFCGQPDKAVPLLEEASADGNYRWNVTRLLAVIALDKNQPQDAERLMSPFAQVEVKDADYAHAYVMISLEIFRGEIPGAMALLDKFPSGNLPAFWKPKFEKLRVKIQNQIP